MIGRQPKRDAPLEAEIRSEADFFDARDVVAVQVGNEIGFDAIHRHICVGKSRWAKETAIDQELMSVDREKRIGMAVKR